MKERPIIFNGDMVRAVLSGTQTQTRRVIKPQPIADALIKDASWWLDCPYGIVGDNLWVRETWRHGGDDSGTYYRADAQESSPAIRWQPSMFMPRALSRITLAITNVRAERVQDISEADAQAEGADEEFRVVMRHPSGVKDYRIPLSYRGGFANLWDAINEKRGYSWEVNPFVWCVSFRQVDTCARPLPASSSPLRCAKRAALCVRVEVDGTLRPELARVVEGVCIDQISMAELNDVAADRTARQVGARPGQRVEWEAVKL